MSESESAADYRSWKIIYPAYLNAKKTVLEGRRVPLSSAVDNPTPAEIAECAKYLGFQVHIEPDKAYSREWTQRGRVRILLKKDGKLINEEIANKRVLLKKIGTMIPKMPQRATKKTEPPPQGKKKGKGKK